MEIGIEVRAIDKASGIGRCPSSDFGIVVALAKVDPACLGIYSLAGKAPGIADLRVGYGLALSIENGFFTEGGIAVGFDRLSSLSIE